MRFENDSPNRKARHRPFTDEIAAARGDTGELYITSSMVGVCRRTTAWRPNFFFDKKLQDKQISTLAASFDLNPNALGGASQLCYSYAD